MSVPFRRLILALLVFGAAAEVEVEAASPRQLDSGTVLRLWRIANESGLRALRENYSISKTFGENAEKHSWFLRFELLRRVIAV